MCLSLSLLIARISRLTQAGPCTESQRYKATAQFLPRLAPIIANLAAQKQLLLPKKRSGEHDADIDIRQQLALPPLIHVAITSIVTSLQVPNRKASASRVITIRPFVSDTPADSWTDEERYDGILVSCT